METYKIKIKQNKSNYQYIKITKTLNNCLYSYYNINYKSNKLDFEAEKSSFNKFAFIEYLKEKKINNKIIKEVEEVK